MRNSRVMARVFSLASSELEHPKTNERERIPIITPLQYITLPSPPINSMASSSSIPFVTPLNSGRAEKKEPLPTKSIWCGTVKPVTHSDRFPFRIIK